MSLTMRIVLLLCFLGTITTVMAQSSVPVIRGTVVDAETNLPIRGARITRSQLFAVGSTREDGTFEVEVTNPTPLMVRKAGYAQQELRPTAGQVIVRLQRGAAVTAIVMDRTGERVPGARVHLQCGNRGQGGQADDRGEWRISGLAPGACDVALDAQIGPIGASGPMTAEQMQARQQEIAGRIQEQRRNREQVKSSIVLRAGDEAVVILEAADGYAAAVTTAVTPRQGETGSAVLRGRITDARNRPVANAQVVLRGDNAGQMVLSDAAGNYVFSKVPAGQFRVAALPPGGQLVQYGQTPASTLGALIPVREGEELGGLDMAITRGASLSGVVLDEFGEPLEMATVQAIAVEPRPSGGRPGRSDDLGRFRVTNLAPGSYHIVADFASDTQAPASRIYYPNTSVRSEAATVTVGSDDLDGFTIQRSRPFKGRLAGTVVNAAGGPPVNATLTASMRTAPEMPSVPRATTRARADGSFEFAGLEEGEYEVVAAASPGAFVVVLQPGQSADDLAQAPVEYGHASVRVTGATSVAIRTAPPATIAGRVEIEGDRAGVAPDGFRIVAGSAAALLPAPPSAPVDGRWQFELSGLYKTTRFDLRASSPEWYLKSFVVNGVDAAETPLDVTSTRAVRNVTAVVARAARVAGTVRSEGRAARDGYVLAFPVDPAKRYEGSRHTRAARIDLAGNYALYLPPGQYWIAAVAGSAPPYPGEALFTELQPRATALTVQTPEPVRQDLAVSQ